MGWRSESSLFLFKTDVLRYNYCLSNLGQRRQRVLRAVMLHSPPGEFNLDNYLVSLSEAVSPLTSEVAATRPSAYYSTVTSLTAFHIVDGWSVCRQVAVPDIHHTHKRGPRGTTHCCPRASSQLGRNSTRHYLSQKGTVACLVCRLTHRYTNMCIHTRTDVPFMKFPSCRPASRTHTLVYLLRTSQKQTLDKTL